ncbi:MAG: biotin transporter BioY [Chloroflexota bacterium]
MDAHLPVPGITAGRRLTSWSTLAWIGRELLLLSAGTVFLALTARISLPLPFSPVPITGQTLGVLLIGALYGPYRGAVTVLAYLGEGLAGLPVFAGGRAGLPVLLGPTGGFLLGFLPGVFLAGFAAPGRRAAFRLGVMLLASLVIYVVGVPWLMVSRGLPVELALVAGMLPFIPSEVLKEGLAAGVTPAGARLLRLR